MSGRSRVTRLDLRRYDRAMGRLNVAEVKNLLERHGHEFPFFMQTIGDGDAPGTVEISVWTGDGERARRYFRDHPVRIDGVEVPIIVSEGRIEPV